MNRDDNGLVLIIVLVAVFWFMTQQKKNQDAVQPANNISNAEVWKWRDYKGQDRSITITRDVHVS